LVHFQLTLDTLLALKGDSQIWPDDDTFRSAWLSRPLYQSLRAGKTRMLLEALELAQRTSKQENVPLPGGLTIEHVMPQAWEPDEWPIADPAETGKVIRNQLLHTIGNLTLVTQPLNSALSRGPFKNKRPEITKSLLMLNSYFQRDEFCSATAVWNEEIIMKRSSELFIVAKNVWPRRSSELEASR